MFDIGFGEMLMIAAIALIAIGPKQLPEVARTLGRMINEFKRATGDFTKSFSDTRDSTRSVFKDIQNSITHTPPKPDSQLAEDMAETSTAPSAATQPAAPVKTAVEDQLAFNINEFEGYGLPADPSNVRFPLEPSKVPRKDS